MRLDKFFITVVFKNRTKMRQQGNWLAKYQSGWPQFLYKKLLKILKPIKPNRLKKLIKNPILVQEKFLDAFQKTPFGGGPNLARLKLALSNGPPKKFAPF